MLIQFKKCMNVTKYKKYIILLLSKNPPVITIFFTDYLRHAPCMRVVQAGYERCAADYQTRIKALNAQTQVSSNCVINDITIFINVAINDIIPNSRMLRKHMFMMIASMPTNMNTLKVQTTLKNSPTN